ncbi:MAG: DUF2855 family protein [Rhodoferax sp.]|jgi:hypothetical protein|nr:DUF2855 family protein [Rhodoferax sp.]
MTTQLWVRKGHLQETSLRQQPDGPLAQGQVRVRIDHFALTSNNITYGAFGDAMHYWDFFPTGEDSWGIIPVWGFGTVVQSEHAGLVVGERLYGYFPMADTVVLSPGRLSDTAFTDSSPHRAALPRVYNQYLRCASDPFYSPDTEAVQALLRPLFTTSWLIDDFLADNDFFGARVVVLSSASSKTAYGTAFALARRSGIEVVGLTSAANRAFCESLRSYARVLDYAQLAQIGATDVPCVYVDFAGNAELRRALHGRLTGLRYSCSIGGTHVDQLGSAKDLPGPKPVLFFAPSQIAKRHAEWGGAVLEQRLVEDWRLFRALVSDPVQPWLQVQQHTGPQAVRAAYQQVLAGQGDPRVGHVLTL